MFDNFLGAGTSKSFGKQMAMLLVQATQNETTKAARSKSQIKSRKRFESTLLAIEKQLSEFKLRQRLNIYSTARLGSEFKFTLLDHGFEPETAEDMTTWLLLRCK